LPEETASVEPKPKPPVPTTESTNFTSTTTQPVRKEKENNRFLLTKFLATKLVLCDLFTSQCE